MLAMTQLAGFGSSAASVGGGGGSPTDADAIAYIARTTGMTAQCQLDIEALIVNLKAHGLWTGLDVLCVASDADTAAHAEANSLLNICQNLYNGATIGSPPFVEDEGWTLTGTDYIDTNFSYSPFTPTLFAADANMFGCYMRALCDVGGVMMGADQFGEICSMERDTSTTYQGTNESVSCSFSSTGLGLIGSSRGHPNIGYFAISGPVSCAPLGASNSPPNGHDFFVGALNNAGTPQDYATNGAFGAWFAGLGTGSTSRISNMRSAIQAYFTARGTAV